MKERRELFPPGPTELQIAVQSTGLCGSDLHYFNHGRNGDILLQEPLILGHESAGEVVAIGDKVQGFAIGDRVALEVGIPCGTCGLCKSRRYNICKSMRFRSSAKSFPHFQGTLQERINHPQEWCHKLPQTIPLELGALLEPMGVAINASRRAQLPSEATILVFGAGAVGLLCACMARQAGASKVIIADINPARLEIAVQKGYADQAFLVSTQRGETIVEKLAIAKNIARGIAQLPRATDELTGEVDVVFECTGAESCTQASIYATKPGGRIMLIGMGNPIQTLPLAAAAQREVDLCGVFRYAYTYADGIDILSDPKHTLPDLGSLVTHRFYGLENARAGFDMAARAADDQGNLVMKVVIDMAGKVGPAEPIVPRAV